MILFLIIKLIKSDGGIWPADVRQPADMQGAKSNKMEVILEDKVYVDYMACDVFPKWEDFFNGNK